MPPTVDNDVIAGVLGKLDSNSVNALAPGLASLLLSQYDLRVQIANLEADKLLAMRTGDTQNAAVIQQQIDALTAALEAREKQQSSLAGWAGVAVLVVILLLVIVLTLGARR